MHAFIQHLRRKESAELLLCVLYDEERGTLQAGSWPDNMQIHAGEETTEAAVPTDTMRKKIKEATCRTGQT